MSNAFHSFKQHSPAHQFWSSVNPDSQVLGTFGADSKTCRTQIVEEFSQNSNRNQSQKFSRRRSHSSCQSRKISSNSSVQPNSNKAKLKNNDIQFKDINQNRKNISKSKSKSKNKRKKSSKKVDRRKRESSSKVDKSQKKGKHNEKKYHKKSKKDYSINPLYMSRISEMLSEISVPTTSPKASLSELARLETRVTNQIFSLREEKIRALERLSAVIDKKNKAIELIKKHSVRQDLGLTQGQTINQQFLFNQQKYHQVYGVKEGSSYKIHSSRMSRKTPQLLYSQISDQKVILENAANQVEKIRKQLMGALSEHPLISRNRELREELSQLKDQIGPEQLSKSRMNVEIDSYTQENLRIEAQLKRHKQKLNNAQKSRFETFFPQDRKKANRVNSLIAMQAQLLQKRNALQRQMMDGTIIRRAEDQILIQQLRHENRQLEQDCDRLLAVKPIRNQSQFDNSELLSLSVEQLQELVEKEKYSKRVFQENLSRFRQSISVLQTENAQLMMR